MGTIQFVLQIVFAASMASGDGYDAIKAKLKSLKALCDSSLLDSIQCKNERDKLLNSAQSPLTDDNFWFCNYAGETKPGETLPENTKFNYSENSSANKIVFEILSEVGLTSNFIVRAASVPNAAASIRFGERYIEYNPTFIGTLKKGTQRNWSVYSVLAHEIGHHLKGHTIKSGGSRPDIELEADEYSGFILAELGATLEEAQLAMKTFGSDARDGTHPSTQPRLDAIERGWHDGIKRKKHIVDEDPINNELPDNPIQPNPNQPIQTTNPIISPIIQSNGYPPGFGMQICGCWGPNPPFTAPENRCSSGMVRLNPCAGVCFGGGSPYAYVCQ